VGDIRKVARRLAEVDQIEYVVITTGSYDLILEVCAPARMSSSTRSTTASARSKASATRRPSEKNVYVWGRRLADR